MPQARRAGQRSARSSTFKEPPALKQLTRSLEAAQAALGKLRTHAGRGASDGARGAYTELRSSLAGASRHSGRLSKALARDFEQAEKRVAQAAKSGARTAGGTARGRAKPSAGKGRATRKRT